MVNPVTIHSIEQLTDDYDLFLFDQYGVLHDGCNTYLGMVECLTQIKAAGKSVAVISNSGKRADYNAQRLSGFGFGSALVDAVITSGEVAWTLLTDILQNERHSESPHVKKPQRVFYIGRGKDRSAIAGLPLQETDDASQCDVIMITGSEPERHSLEQYSATLQLALERHVPAYCTNPDRWSLVGQVRQFGSGQIAHQYESAGGNVVWIGKPYPEIYQCVLRQFALPAERVLCIGDSIEHDIAGANAAGCASVLTATGILTGLNRVELQSHYERCEATPTYLIERNNDDPGR